MRFVSTMWTVIGEAKTGSRKALDTILARYRAPLLDYLKGCGVSEHDAEDVVQEVFIEISDEQFLNGADKTKGKFRTLLLRVTQHVLASDLRKKYRLKRGGGRDAVSLEEVGDVKVAPGDEDRFNELWARNMVKIALERLKRDATRLKVPYHEVLVLRFLEGKSTKEVAEKLKCKPHDVENYVYHGKSRLKKHLQDLAREYCSSPDEHEEETKLLMRYAF